MDQQVNQYLKQLLTTFDSYTPSLEDVKLIQRDKTQFIVNKLALKKFRKRKLTAETRQAIAKKVGLSIKENRPLHFVIPFGGYKHFWNPSHPEPDWAELFNLTYLTEYVSPVLSVHKPGVIIKYASEDLVLNRMNNYPKETLEVYSNVFRQLIDWYNNQTPDNLTFKYFRVSERCDASKILSGVEKLLPKRKQAFDKLSKKEQEQEIHRSMRSVFWNGAQDLTKLTDLDKEKRIIESRFVELAFYETEGSKEFMGTYYWEDNRICICFSFGTTHDNDPFEDLTLGSTYGSIVDHWIGREILKKRGNRLIPDIVSKNQYTDIKDDLKTIVVKELPPHKNYSQIEVLEENK